MLGGGGVVIMSEEMYKQQIIERYRQPRFKGVLGQVSADVAETNPLCGDAIRFQLFINDGVIAGVAWQGEGCAISLAAADLLAELVMGKTREEIGLITAEDMVKLLGIEIKPSRMKCATLPLVCLQRLPDGR
jgi:nitrogen fixation protein NifU and related proteins